MAKWLGLCDFTTKGLVSTPGQGTKIPQAMQHSQKKKNYDRRQLDLVLYERISLLSDMIKLPYRPSNCKITTYILIA